MKYLVWVLCLFLFLSHNVFAADVYEELKETVRAEVLEITDEYTEDIVGTDTDQVVQTVQIQVTEGKRRGSHAELLNDITPLTVGDSIYVNRLETIDGVEYYQFKDVDRRWALVSLVGLFAIVLILFSGTHGIRALVSLALSIGLMFFVLVPLLLKGYPPVPVSVCVSVGMLAIVLFSTHGVHPRSVIAFLGTFGAVVVTGGIALLWSELAHLTGLSSDAAIYLNFSTKGSLDFSGLLLGSIIIGILGILDDVAITQASVVEELQRANNDLNMRELYKRALRVGRDHIGSLVNTLALAYVGAALPLVLLMVAAQSSLALALNQEIVAVELVRIFVGSIGLVLAVPFTTFIAAWWYDVHEVPMREEGAHGHTH